MNQDACMKEFVEFLKRYENVPIPDLDSFNQEALNYQPDMQEIKDLPEAERRRLCAYMIEHAGNFHELLQVYLYSVLAYFFDGDGYTGKLLALVRDSRYLIEDNRFFVYNQLLMYSFRIKGYLDADSRWELRMMYREIYQSYRTQLGIARDVVPVSRRNRRVIVFMIGQYLTELHGPTKTILDRCEVMAKKMGVTPVIINTAEMRAAAGYIPFFLPLFGSYLEEMQNARSVSYRGQEYPFIQCSGMMPDLQEMAGVVQTVEQLNPYCIIQVGGSSICADLCSNRYPVITVGTVPSSIMTSESQFLLKGGVITDADRKYISRLGFAEDYLQYCPFTWSYKPQTTKAARQQFGIPEEAFTIIIVGARLDYEVDEELIENVLLPVMEQGILVVFTGEFKTYPKRVEQYPMLKERSVYTGFVDDILAVDEICDVYVNPRRDGGGTSVVEAMAKKVPPVTLHHGDVALGAGEYFCVEDYPSMVRQILRLRDDPQYYREMAEKAYERMKIVTNSQEIFWETFQRIEKLPEFQ